MTHSRVRLESLEITNYLGAGGEAVTVEFGGENAVLCGPNGSGKTTALSALDRIRRVNWASVVGGREGPRPGSGLSSPWYFEIIEWVEARGVAAANLFHGESPTLQVTAGFSAPKDFDADGANLLASLGGLRGDSIRASFGAGLRNNDKAQIRSVHLGGVGEIFRMGSATSLFSLETPQGRPIPYYKTSKPEPWKLFGLLNAFLRRVVYFPSHRQPRLGSDRDMDGLAGGEGLVSWIKGATNPNPTDAESTRRHNLLQAFHKEFADFIGAKTVSLSVPDYSQPPQDNRQPELNVTVDGRLRLLSQLGAGIGESLIILLVAKLSQELQTSPIDVVLLEEPELHLHPGLQRKLLEKLADYGVQIIASTHSPTVLNWFASKGGRIFRTEFDADKKQITARQVPGLTEQRTLLESIGASPADVLLADKLLLVEGANDVPVFKAWLEKAPSLGRQNVAVLPLGGSAADSPNFDLGQFRNLHWKIRAILDSERTSEHAEPKKERLEIKDKLEKVRVTCHLTERRATENYFTPQALKKVYGDCPDNVERFGDPNLEKQGVKGFAKSRNGEVARAMEWAEIGSTDIGGQIEEFLRS